MSYRRGPDGPDGKPYFNDSDMRRKNHARCHPSSCFYTKSVISAQTDRSKIWTICNVYLDEMSEEAKIDSLIPKMGGISYKFSFTLLMLCSTHFFAEHTMFEMNALQERGQLVGILRMSGTFAFLSTS